MRPSSKDGGNSSRRSSRQRRPSLVDSLYPAEALAFRAASRSAFVGVLPLVLHFSAGPCSKPSLGRAFRNPIPSTNSLFVFRCRPKPRHGEDHRLLRSPPRPSPSHTRIEQPI